MSVIVFTPNTWGVNCITSVQLAKLFGREPKNVKRDIEDLLKEGFGGSNFEPSDYIDSRGKTQPMWLLTETGFAIVVTSLNLKSDAHKFLRRNILTQFHTDRERDQAELKKLQAQKAWLTEKAGKLVKNPFGTRLERPKVTKENKKIQVTPEMAEDLGIEAGLADANSLDFSGLISVMRSLARNRIAGINNTLEKLVRYEEAAADYIEAELPGNPIDPLDYGIHSEYSEILMEKLDEVCGQEMVDTREAEFIESGIFIQHLDGSISLGEDVK